MHFLSGPLAIRVFLCFAFAYLLSYAFRSVNAVIASDLLRDAGLLNADLGLLTSAYFLSFAGLQLPLGIWLDKYGPRRTEAALLLLAAAGAAIFATSTSLAGLWIGRALIGAGVSACLMASFKAYRQWFAPERQSQLASWMLVAGTSGALAATVPVSAALPWIGWRGVFWIMSGLIVAAATAIFFLLKKVEHMHAAQASSASAPRHNEPAGSQGYADIFRHPYFRRMAFLGTVNVGSFVALQTLWVGPWMMTVLGMNQQQTAHILFAFNLCMLLAYLGLSWWAPRYLSHEGTRGYPVIRIIGIGIAATIALQAAMLMTSASWSWIFWIAMAVFITVTTLVQTSVSLSFPTALAGRANSAFNLLLFVGAFLAQWGIGVLIDAFEARGASPPTAMRMAFAICLAWQAFGFIAFLLGRTQPTKPS
ncbi:MAG TPA: MFS transporter [Noviherbaspirillum sp.]|nr:MFS transporter [Noviherbaspirillum sp.]